MEQIIQQFIHVRKEFIEALAKFPEDRVDDAIFGEWSLKCVLAHLTGWDSYFTEILRLLRAGKEIPYWGSINKFNQASVENRKMWSWEKIYKEFVRAGDEFIKQYNDLPQDFYKALFWKGRRYTPTKVLKINIHHYEKSHLQEIRKKLSECGIR